MGEYVIGIDAGTESLRAGVFDLEGQPLAFVATPYETRFPHPSWAEQDPRAWWQALGESVRKVLAETAIRPEAVSALAVDTTCCSVVALDASGQPVRPALIWMDVRSAEQARQILETGDPALAVNSAGRGPVSAEWMIPKALWLKQHEPDHFAAARYVCEFQDFLNYHLTGRMVASVNNASVRWHYGVGSEGYPGSLLEALGLSALNEKWPATVVPLGEMVGGLTPAAADHLGLPTATPVAQGGADAFVAMLGLGVTAPGQMAFITGSSHLQLGLSEKPFHGVGIWGTYADAVLPGLHVVEGGQTSTGSIVNWFKRMLGDGVNYAELNAEAAALPPGSEGLVVQDHFQGNRTPHTDPHSRGAITGLTLKHQRGHLFRAIIEGIAYGSELILETMRSNGFDPDSITLAGGASRSDLWLQIHADVSGVPIALTAVPDAPSLGSAVLAAAAAGHYPDIRTAAATMVRVVRTVEPDPSMHDRYRPFYEAYKATYPALADIPRGWS